ncbi:hypothetical protein QTG54_006900 [Skeletonema marinoi]|uniref:Uncharacterized protein n=1 Tax=Skeletonema marinoi TaxID=267567 RepID=A0AAD9DE26_9STRA|nr:hypothetical protein QTG54_006900 [Skeletonema marinoi]
MTSSNDRTKIAITVPTKKHDGGSDSESAASSATASKPRVDAFAKYSSNLIRMKELLLLGDDDDDLDYLASLNEALRHASIGDHAARNRNNHAGDASKRRKGNNSQPVKQQGFLERKTRVSFELHPSLLLHDLIDLNASAYIPDDEDESEG